MFTGLLEAEVWKHDWLFESAMWVVKAFKLVKKPLKDFCSMLFQLQASQIGHLPKVANL